MALWTGPGGSLGVALSESPAAQSEQAALSVPGPQLAGRPGRTRSGLGRRCQGDPALGWRRGSGDDTMSGRKRSFTFGAYGG